MPVTLKELIESKVTLISVHTEDEHLIQEVLESMFPEYTFCMFALAEGGEKEKEAKAKAKLAKKPLVFFHAKNTTPTSERIKGLSKDQYTVLLVNYAGEELQSYDFGFLGTPSKLLKPIMLGFDAEEKEEVTKAVQGLSFTNAKQLIRLGIHRGVPKTYKAYTHLRSEMYGSSDGIYTVDVSKGVYTPAADLKMWFDANRSFMFSSYEDLRPRGVLLHGVGGTGKTEFSKYCSRELQVPLFRLDIASSLSRWQGESEANIRQCLKYVEEHSPCILLIDEVEKALPKSNSEESSTRILGHLLWWLQEHQSNVFSVMTVNDKSLLPPELFRDGRIDAVFELKPLQDAETCAAIAFAWFSDWKLNHDDVPTDVVDGAYEITKAHFGSEELSYTPAAIVNLCKHVLRTQLAKLEIS